LTAAEFAAMADPSKNPNFRRLWTGPPEKEEAPVRRHSEPEADLFDKVATKTNSVTRSDQQRLIDAANRLFAPRRGDR
jgi:hypothetical protein